MENEREGEWRVERREWRMDLKNVLEIMDAT